MTVCALVILGICSQRQLLGIMPISVKKPWPRVSNYLNLCPHVYREVQVKNIRLPNVGKGMQILHFSKIHSFLSTNWKNILYGDIKLPNSMLIYVKRLRQKVTSVL